MYNKAKRFYGLRDYSETMYAYKHIDLNTLDAHAQLIALNVSASYVERILTGEDADDVLAEIDDRTHKATKARKEQIAFETRVLATLEYEDRQQSIMDQTAPSRRERVESIGRWTPTGKQRQTAQKWSQ